MGVLPVSIAHGASGGKTSLAEMLAEQALFGLGTGTALNIRCLKKYQERNLAGGWGWGWRGHPYLVNSQLSVGAHMYFDIRVMGDVILIIPEISVFELRPHCRNQIQIQKERDKSSVFLSPDTYSRFTEAEAETLGGSATFPRHPLLGSFLVSTSLPVPPSHSLLCPRAGRLSAASSASPLSSS